MNSTFEKGGPKSAPKAHLQSEKSRRKSYLKPTLVKGAVISKITATIVSDPTCWVARAAFGESDIRWVIFRAWLLDDAPAWFRNLYLRRGEAFAAWLETQTGARAVVRAAMGSIVRRKLRS
jgi:hypothetical protein